MAKFLTLVFLASTSRSFSSRTAFYTWLGLILAALMWMIDSWERCVTAQDRTAAVERGNDSVPQWFVESAEDEQLSYQLHILRNRVGLLGKRHPNYKQASSELADLERRVQAMIERRKRPQVGEMTSSTSATVTTDPASSSTRNGRRAVATPSVDRQNFKPLLTPAQLKLVGGWQMPSQGAGGLGLGHTHGGLMVEANGNRERLIYMYGHDRERLLHVLSVSLDHLGTDVAKRLEWPIAEPRRSISGTHAIKANRAYSLCRPNPGGQLLTTGRVFYATNPATWVGPWMNWFNESDGSTTALTVPPQFDRRQVFGGGFCSIPNWFADGYLGGRRFGVGYGGYQSGQQSSPGPTLFAADWPRDGDREMKNCLELLSFQWEGKRERRERRPPDYTKPLYGPAAENGLGWWQADEVSAGPVWIDTPELTGLCYWSIQGLGDLKYILQTTAFSHERRCRLYVYDPADLAAVAEGKIEPHQVRGDSYEWPLPFDDSPSAKHWPIGAYWDANDKLLYLSYRRSGGGKYEIPPVVVVYQVSINEN